MLANTFVGIGIVAEKTFHETRRIVDFGVQFKPFFIVRNGFFIFSQMTVCNGPVYISVGKTGTGIELNGFVIVLQSLAIVLQGI